MATRKNIGIYIHIPFCVKKCPYCDFYSIKYENKSNLQKQYVEALEEEIKTYKAKKNKFVVDTIYFGGGTPSLIAPEYIKKILRTIKNVFKCKNLEVTLEANPNTLDFEYLKKLKKSGINRLSIGLQSANDDELYLLGRLHTANNVKVAIDLAHKVGFKNISVDLILGLPNQTIDKIKNSIKFIEQLNINHVSAYMLQIEKNTIFNNQNIIQKLPNEDVMADMYLFVVDKLREIGFVQYEISNFSKPGFESKHNMRYWNRNEYIGFGAAAHSFCDNKRYYLENNIYKYIGMGKEKNFIYNYSEDENNIESEFNEYIMLKLRTVLGINIDDMKANFSEDLVNIFLDNVKKYCNEKYIYYDEKNIRLTKYGFLIYNTIVSNLMIN